MTDAPSGEDYETYGRALGQFAASMTAAVRSHLSPDLQDSEAFSWGQFVRLVLIVGARNPEWAEQVLVKTSSGAFLNEYPGLVAAAVSTTKLKIDAAIQAVDVIVAATK